MTRSGTSKCFTISALLVVALGSAAHAEGTLGVEWEFKPEVGVIGVTVVGQPQDHVGTLATEADVNERPDRLTVGDGQRIMCSTEDANEKYPLVSITHDLQWQRPGDAYGSMTLEIVTGPIGYSDQAHWKEVTAFVTKFFKAAREVCVTKRLRSQRIQNGLPEKTTDTIDLCYASVESIVNKMNTTDPDIARTNANGRCDGNDPQKAENPKTVGLFFTKGFFTWHDISDVSVGSTQVNVALKLTTLAQRDIEPLFYLQHGVAASTYRHTRNKITESGYSDTTKGFLTLFAYGVNVATEAARRGSEYTGMMVGNKNLYDLYPKSLLGEVFLKAEIADEALDGTRELCAGDSDHVERCREVSKTWNAEIRKGKGGDPVRVAKPVGPFGQGVNTEVVVEMRRLSHPLNQALTLTRGWFSSKLELADFDKMKAFFDRYFAE